MDDELAAFKAEMGGLLDDEPASAATTSAPPAASSARVISAAAPMVISAAPVRSCSINAAASAPTNTRLPPSQWASPDKIRAQMAAEGFIVPHQPSAVAAAPAASSSSIAASSSSSLPTPPSSGAPFIPAASFKGARPGYVFKSGTAGVGYYLEGAAAPPPPPMPPPPGGGGGYGGGGHGGGGGGGGGYGGGGRGYGADGGGGGGYGGGGGGGGGYGGGGSGTAQQQPQSGSGLSAAARKYGQTFDPSVVPAGAAATTSRNITKSIAGQTWKDETLLVWPEDDFRIFVGDLGNEANDDVLSAAFRKYPSFQMARVVRDKHSHKSKGYGFVSFKDPWDMTKALREMQGKYVGNRPIKVRKSTDQERSAGNSKKDPVQFNAALSVADKSMKRQLEKGGAIQKKPSWKEKKRQKQGDSGFKLPW
jgi:hypothetical protein